MPLSTLYETSPRYRLGDSVVVRDPAGWGGPPLGSPPRQYTYTALDRRGRATVCTIEWNAHHLQRVGQIGEVTQVNPCTHVLFVAFGGAEAPYSWHPDWLAAHRPAPPAGNAIEPLCLCASPALHEPGCAWKVWRDAKRKDAT